MSEIGIKNDLHFVANLLNAIKYVLPIDEEAEEMTNKIFQNSITKSTKKTIIIRRRNE